MSATICFLIVKQFVRSIDDEILLQILQARVHFILDVGLDKFRVREMIKRTQRRHLGVSGGKRVAALAIAKVRTHLGGVANQSDDPVFREITFRFGV